MIALAHLWRALFLAASAPMVGSALLALIATLTGARWPAAERAWRWLPLVALGAAGLGVAQGATPSPPHLAWWLNPITVGTRGTVAALALWWALRRSPSTTTAGIMLALYAALVTPIAADWMLGQVPGHSVSAAGMMLACQQVAAGCALPLALGQGGERERRDLAKLMVAAALGLGYLLFMDYLVVWFGNLPSHVDFYVECATGWAGWPLWLAGLLGWVVPIALLPRDPADRRRLTGTAVLAATALVDLWWVGVAPLVALIAAAGLAIGAVALIRRGTPAHG